MLRFNLQNKSNRKLRGRLLLGQITPSKLVIMTPGDLASEEASIIADKVRRDSFQRSVIVKESSGKVMQKTHKGEFEIVYAGRN